MRFLLILLLFAACSSFVSSKKLTPEEDIERARICGTSPDWFNPQNVTETVRVRPEQAPWTVLIKLRDVDYGIKSCTGSWISRRHIVTSRGCMEKGMWFGYYKCTEKPEVKDAIYIGNFTDIAIFTARGRRLPVTPSTIYSINWCDRLSPANKNPMIIELPRDVKFNKSRPVWPICTTGDTSLEQNGTRLHTFFFSETWGSNEGQSIYYHPTTIDRVKKDRGYFYVKSPNNITEGAWEKGGSNVVRHQGRTTLVGVNCHEPALRFSIGQFAKKICDRIGICVTTFV